MNINISFKINIFFLKDHTRCYAFLAPKLKFYRGLKNRLKRVTEKICQYQGIFLHPLKFSFFNPNILNNNFLASIKPLFLVCPVRLM